jgi:hypothetical protein
MTLWISRSRGAGHLGGILRPFDPPERVNRAHFRDFLRLFPRIVFQRVCLPCNSFSGQTSYNS